MAGLNVCNVNVTFVFLSIDPFMYNLYSSPIYVVCGAFLFFCYLIYKSKRAVCLSVQVLIISRPGKQDLKTGTSPSNLHN